MDLGDFRCRECKMNFRSPVLLEKHRDKFCIGGYVEDSCMLNQRLRECLPKDSADGNNTWRASEPRKSETPDHMMLHIQDQRRKRERLRQHDRDKPPDNNSFNEREQNLLRGHQSEIRLSDNQALRKLTDEFHKLRLSIQENRPTSKPSEEEDEISPRINRDSEHRERLREIAVAHGQHLADIQARNQNLELQREEIRRRLQEFSCREYFTGHVEQMLLELKAQEQKNRLALDELREQIELLQMESIKRPSSVSTVASPAPQKSEEKIQFTFLPFASSGNLAAEISALRIVYLQSGGRDPGILAQFNALQAEAQLLKTSTRPIKEKRKRQDPTHRLLDAELLTVELENQHLEDEILKLQREKRKVDDGMEMQEMQWEHVRQLAVLKGEIKMLRNQSNRVRMSGGINSPPPMLPLPPPPPPPPPHMDHIRPQTPMIAKHLLDPPDVLGPSPFDPGAGFTIFYDFVLGLDATYCLIRLVTGLYSNGQEMGKPRSLPAVYCEMRGGSQYVAEGLRGNIATLSAKQPVPRVSPSPAISLIMELQAAGGFDVYSQEIVRLVSRGWAKIDLFDVHNRVISGKWKVPVRLLPVNPSLTTGQLNGIPQVGSAEIYLRVVNGRDADVQSLAAIDPNNASVYKYPPSSGSHNTLPAASYLPSQHCPTHRHHPLPPTDHIDLPPPVSDADLPESNAN